ncbi:hypothetical protein [Aquisediminimonas sediminicola]|uniref:hypothetical protein n=1 Tax=Alteraquisediminimonas sediminicola TaxID=2676787 RepID=UPI001C8E175B|nr:hypothetical protein [Aquisediminimonas sediminicola]
MTVLHLLSMLSSVLTLGLALAVLVAELSIAWSRMTGPAAGSMPTLRGDFRTARSNNAAPENIIRRRAVQSHYPSWPDAA